MPAQTLLAELIAFPSISSSSNVDVSRFLSHRLAAIGFEIEEVPYSDASGIEKLNIVARRLGTQSSGSGGLAYFAHTDVVPAGNWTGPGSPFQPVVFGGNLYGRGSCDMKGSIAAFLTACERFTRHDKPVWIVLTGDEETGMQGADTVARQSALYRDLVDRGAAGIIGEPTAGMVIHGHKGISHWTATTVGRAGHSSTLDGDSATLRLIPFLAAVRELSDELETNPRWHDNRYSPVSPRLNLAIDDDSPALNVTSSHATAQILLRNSPDLDIDEIDNRLRAAAHACGAGLSELHFRAAIYREPESQFVQTAARLVGNGTVSTVPYGTDGSCFDDVAELIVYGPGNIAQAHTPAEYISLHDLENGVNDYCLLLETLTSA